MIDEILDQETLRREWDELKTAILRVIDPETGHNMADAKIRKRADHSTYLYVDEVDGWQILTITERNYLTCEVQQGRGEKGRRR